ncbi:MAG TPA: type 2 isopentenyl-diphosphate Delta-isomerase [Candidatus Dormibacteraeota bacterium]|nr:type 2 isopentenyl-diphosphate Delta-isomerase [Candidatus Dormibacteraeota bacterium]
MAEQAGRTASRKAEHLRINLDDDVQSGVSTGLERWRFVPLALPDLDLDDIDTNTTFLEYRLQAPFLVSCMTGGTSEATAINQVLARVAQARGIALGLGSGRALLEDPGSLASFEVRDLVPSVPLLANLGAIQLLRGVSADDCNRLVELLRADALVLHLNALQEALQEGGDVNFSGLLPAIESLSGALRVPLLVKEVGWGIPPDDVQRLFGAGVAAVDVAGAGGTSWSEVERHRTGAGTAAAAAAFRDWGLPTADAVRRAREASPGGTIIASGGILDGLQAAKAIGLGADMVGVAGPFLRAAATGEGEAMNLAGALADGLRVAMFCTGCGSVEKLRGTPRLEPVPV